MKHRVRAVDAPGPRDNPRARGDAVIIRARKCFNNIKRNRVIMCELPTAPRAPIRGPKMFPDPRSSRYQTRPVEGGRETGEERIAESHAME